jgi:hypothetical protein
MKDCQEIRIFIETGKRDFSRAQEVVIRTMFQRYFAKDAYRAAISLVLCQMLGCFTGLWLGTPTWALVMIVLGAGLAQGLVRGLALWASSPPPTPPSPTGLPAQPDP